VEGYGYHGRVIWLNAEDKANVEAAKQANTDATMSLNWYTGKVQVGETAIATITSRSAPSDAQAAATKAVISEARYDNDFNCNVRTLIAKDVLTYYAQESGETLSDEEFEAAWISMVRYYCLWDGCTIYSGDVPAGAMMGIQNADTKQVVWLNVDDYKKLENAEDDENGSGEESIDWNTGVITVNGTKMETLTTRLNAENQQKPAANDGSGTALLIVGGAVVAAGVATAVYFVTHPAAWQKVVNNVRSALGLPTETAPAAENGEAPETAETEEAAETAAPAETTAAA
jgi:hypothetical protein